MYSTTLTPQRTMAFIAVGLLLLLLVVGLAYGLVQLTSPALVIAVAFITLYLPFLRFGLIPLIDTILRILDPRHDGSMSNEPWEDTDDGAVY